VRYFFHLLIYLNVYVIVALSLNLVLGHCGLLTLAHAGYFAIGAYAYALLTLTMGFGFLPAAVIAIAIAFFLSLAVSLPAARFKGDNFVMLSLAVQSLVFGLAKNWFDPDSPPGTLKNLTNGSSGLSGVPKPSFLGWHIETTAGIAILATVLAMACIAIISLLVFSPWGRVLHAIRDDELAARSLGKKVWLAKVQCFGIASGMVALAGAIYSTYVGFIDPTSASVDQSILMICMVLVGGSGNLKGPILGALILLGIPELLRFVSIPSAVAPNIRMILFGLLLVGLMHFRPQGFAGVYRVE
jgi:branched-chain amino acid transport system permease protein